MSTKIIYTRTLLVFNMLPWPLRPFLDVICDVLGNRGCDVHVLGAAKAVIDLLKDQPGKCNLLPSQTVGDKQLPPR